MHEQDSSLLGFNLDPPTAATLVHLVVALVLINFSFKVNIFEDTGAVSKITWHVQSHE